jgi:hypothetical protein
MELIKNEEEERSSAGEGQLFIILGGFAPLRPPHIIIPHLVPDRDPTATTVSHFCCCCFGFEEKKKRKEKKREREKEKTREDDKLWFIRRDREWGRK